MRPSPGEIEEQLRKYPTVEQSIVDAYLLRVPAGWYLINHGGDGAAFRRGYINVIVSLEYHDDHEIWIHASATGLKSTPGSWFLPTWLDMKRVKQDFIGENVWAYSVLPPADQYVNDNPYCLHLYGRLDGKPALPDFTRGTTGL